MPQGSTNKHQKADIDAFFGEKDHAYVLTHLSNFGKKLMGYDETQSQYLYRQYLDGGIKNALWSGPPKIKKDEEAYNAFCNGVDVYMSFEVVVDSKKKKSSDTFLAKVTGMVPNDSFKLENNGSANTYIISAEKPSNISVAKFQNKTELIRYFDKNNQKTSQGVTKLMKIGSPDYVQRQDAIVMRHARKMLKLIDELPYELMSKRAKHLKANLDAVQQIKMGQSK